MGKVVEFIKSNHPLVGIWQGDDEDARAQYTISIQNGKFSVSAIDAVDGEIFEITNVHWDSDLEVLSFNSYMPSTGRLGKTVFRLLSDREIEVEFTFTDKSIWKRIAL